MGTGIQWTGETLNLSGGCHKVSPECLNCYAEKLWPRVKHVYDDKPFNVLQLRPDRIEQPLRWKKPRKIFINSMSDLFHPDMPEDFLLKAFEVFLKADWHIIQLLTKQPQRMLEFIRKHGLEPLPKHLWLGTSAGNQQYLNERIGPLLDIECQVRFLSLEPLLGPISLQEANPCYDCGGAGSFDSDLVKYACEECGGHEDSAGHGIGTGIHQVIVGGESGPKGRPLDPDWVRSLRDDCQTADIPFFFKQWGQYSYQELKQGDLPIQKFIHSVGKKKSGNILDGEVWEQFPA